MRSRSARSRLSSGASGIAPRFAPFRVFRAMTGLSLACNPAPHPTDLGLTDGATGEIFDPAEPLPA